MMQEGIGLYIPVELKRRELYAKILLAKYAAERGFVVVLGRKRELNDWVARMPPGIYYGLGTVKNFEGFYRTLGERGHVIAVSDEEGLVTFSDDMYLDLKVSSETLRFVDRLFTWGDENARVIAAGRPGMAEKIRTTGNPRFDLLRHPYRRVYDAEIADIRARYRNLVLICTSFSSCNHYIADLDYVQELIAKRVLTGPESVAIYRRFQRMKVAAWQAFLTAIPLLARAHPQTDFVIRPHPSENPESYLALSRTHTNVHVEDQYSIHPWVLSAKAIVHHYCTSAIEGFAAGTPTFALRPERDSSIEKEIPYECSRECRSPDELVTKVRECLQSVPATAFALVQPSRNYEDYVLNIGPAVASELIADELCRVASPLAGRQRHGAVQAPPSRNGGFPAKLRAAVSSFLPLNRKGRRYLSHKFDGVSAAEVRQVLAAYEGPDVTRFQIDEVASNVIRIRHDRAN
jgi:surface carbohydrate biosynthesis protein